MRPHGAQANVNLAPRSDSRLYAREMADVLDPTEFAEAWYLMLTQVTGLREHARFFQLQDAVVREPMPHPFIDLQGPGIMYIKMVALLEDALKGVGSAKGLVPKKPDVNGWINCLSAAGLLLNATELHRVRRRRNDVAHQPTAVSSWEDLDSDITIVHDELRHLGLVQELPKLRTFIERTPDMTPRPGIAMVHHYRFGVMTAQDVVVFEQTWSKAFYRLGWSPERVAEAQASGEHVPMGVKEP